MISDKLGDLLATMEKVRSIDGVAERDAKIVENRQGREDQFLGQVLRLANIEEASKTSEATKYSDGEIALTFDDPRYAATMLKLAHELGASDADIVPEMGADGVTLHILPHVFAAESMAAFRDMVELGVHEDQGVEYLGFVESLLENPNHTAATGRLSSLQALRAARAGSRSYQFSKPDDMRPRATRRDNDPDNTYNKPHFLKNRQWNIRGKNGRTPCGRAARPYFRRQMGLPEIPQNQWYKRCWDGQIPAWATEARADEIAKMVLAQVMRDKASK